MTQPISDKRSSLPEAERIVRDAVDAEALEREPALRLAASLTEAGVLDAVLEGAFESKRRGKGDRVSVSRNVFIPLTNLCRDRCAYCTFAKQPDSPEAKTYTLDEVAEVVRGGCRAGCIEALFCLGDKPEVAYKAHREWLAARGLAHDHRVPRPGLPGGLRDGHAAPHQRRHPHAPRRCRPCGRATRRWA